MGLRVTPLVGVWIEILSYSLYLLLSVVTPLVGVWIEISAVENCNAVWEVTPLVGVWIEILVINGRLAMSRRHSPRGSVD